MVEVEVRYYDGIDEDNFEPTYASDIYKFDEIGYIDVDSLVDDTLCSLDDEVTLEDLKFAILDADDYYYVDEYDYEDFCSLVSGKATFCY